MLFVDALMRVNFLSPGFGENEVFDKLCEEAVGMLGSEEESFFREGQPPMMMRKLNEQANGIMMPLVATTILGDGQCIVGEGMLPADEVAPIEFNDFSDLAELGFIQVPDLDEADFEAAPLFDLNYAPIDMIQNALDAAAATVALVVLD